MQRKLIRKFGFKRDQSGIINRYFREKEGWDIHLKLTKDYILKSTENKGKKACGIFGSGWLLDVPLKELSEIFDKVYLIDIVHPAQIVHKVKKYGNVALIESDISGFAEPVFQFMKNAKKSRLRLNSVEPLNFNLGFDKIDQIDFVVSLNILNQLDIIICEYIQKFKVFDAQEINDFRRIIQQNHINALPKGKSCLITDYEEINLNDKDQNVRVKSLIFTKLPNTGRIKKWQWNFDLQKTNYHNLKTIFNIIAMEI